MKREMRWVIGAILTVVVVLCLLWFALAQKEMHRMSSASVDGKGITAADEMTGNTHTCAEFALIGRSWNYACSPQQQVKVAYINALIKMIAAPLFIYGWLMAGLPN